MGSYHQCFSFPWPFRALEISDSNKFWVQCQVPSGTAMSTTTNLLDQEGTFSCNYLDQEGLNCRDSGVKYFCFLQVNDHGCLHWEYGHPDELHTIYPKKPLFKRDNTICNQMSKWPKLPSCLSRRSTETVYYHQDTMYKWTIIYQLNVILHGPQSINEPQKIVLVKIIQLHQCIKARKWTFTIVIFFLAASSCYF